MSRTLVVVEFEKAETQAFSHILVVELAIAEIASTSRNVRRTFHVPFGVRVQRSISERDCSHPSCSRVRAHRPDIHFPEYPHDCKQSFALF